MTDALPATNVTCPACAQGFVCGMAAGAAQCWCYELPHRLPVPSTGVARTGDNPSFTGCFCAACLQLQLNMPTTDLNVVTIAPTDPDGPP